MIILETEDVFLRALKETGIQLQELNVIELGNIIIKNCLGVQGKLPAKIWFQNHNIKQHISIDINGKDGALKLDLGTPLKQFNNFDLCTNCGTAEHVEDIYQCYENIHNFTKLNGIIVNYGPLSTHAFKHSLWGYNLHFPYEMAIENNYELIYQDIKIPIKGRNPNPIDNALICWIWRKLEDSPFMTEEDFIEIEPLEERR